MHPRKQPSVACRGPHRKHVSRVRLRVHWSVSSAERGADDIENTASYVVAGWTVFTELLPGNAVINSIAIVLIRLELLCIRTAELKTGEIPVLEIFVFHSCSIYL
jgi:hypothetical protein